MDGNWYEAMIDLLEEGRNRLKQVKLKEKSLVLFLGASGVGKSTCLNYICGCKMIKETDPETGMTYITAEDPVTEIGEGIYSQTFCPDICDVNEETFSLCDCPGFFDNRGTEYMLAGAVLLRETVNAAGNVKGFVVILDYFSLLDSRHVLLGQTARNLREMLGNYWQKQGNILFLINKIPENLAADITDEKIRMMLLKLKEELGENGYDSEAIGSLQYLLEAMLKEGAVTICDPLDKRPERLLEKIRVLTETWEKEIGIGLSDQCRIEIQAVMNTIREQAEQQILAFKKTMTKQMREILRTAAEEEMERFQKNWMTLLRQIASCKESEDITEFLKSVSFGDIGRKQQILSEIKVLGELGVYCSGFPADDISVNVRTAMESALQTELDELEKLQTQYEEQKKEEVRLQNPPYRQQRLMENCHIEAEKDGMGMQSRLYLYVPIPMIKSSDLLTVLSQYALAQIHTIYVYGTMELRIDASFPADIFSGKNLILLGNSLTVEEGDYEINVSGRSGEELCERDMSSAECLGVDGRNGNDGTPSGDLLLSFSEVRKNGTLQLIANGGNGSNGEKGGQGVKGSTGAAGRDAAKGGECGKKAFYKTGALSYYKIEGMPGEQGGNGGNGGNGGKAGCAGDAGHIYLYGAARKFFSANIQTIRGNHGCPGLGGAGGEKGDGGRGGKRGIRIAELHSGGASGGIYHYEVNYFYYPDGYEDQEHEVYDGGEALEKLYRENPEIERTLGSRYADSGKKGVSEGKTGRDGETPGEKAYRRQKYPIVSSDFVEELLLKFGFTNVLAQKNWNNVQLLYQTGLLDTGNLQIGQMYEILQVLEDIEKKMNQMLLSDKKAEDIQEKGLKVRFYQEAAGIYSVLAENLLRSDYIRKEVQEKESFDEWSFILFVLEQKRGFYEQMSQESEISGNRVMDLALLTENIGKLLEELEKGQKEQLKKTYFTEFQDGLTEQMESGKQQIENLRKLVTQKMDAVSEKLDQLLEEILEMREQEQSHIEQLKDKEEQLKREMEVKIALSAITSVLDMTSSCLGIQQVFSGISEGMQSLARNSQDNAANIAELSRTIDLKSIEVMEQGQSELDFELDNRADRSFLTDRMEAANQIKYENFSQSGSETECRLFEQVLTLEKETLRSAANHEEAREQKNNFLDTLDEEQRVKAEQFLQGIEKKEISLLKTRYEKEGREQKLEALKRCDAILEQQKEKLQEKKKIAVANSILNLGSATIKCVTNCISIKDTYQSKIKEIRNAVTASENNIMVLDRLNVDMETFKENMFKNELRPFAEELGTLAQQQDTFAKEVSKLQIRQKMQTLKKMFKGIQINASGEVASLFEDVEAVLETQVAIAEKIDAKKDQLAIGKLMYDLTDENAIQWSEEQLGLKQSVLCNHIRYLCQLEAAALQMQVFPFGGYVSEILRNCPIGLSTEKNEIIRQAVSQNDAIRQWIAEQRYQWVQRNSYILKKVLPGSLRRKNGTEQNYAVHVCTDMERRRLLTGEEITFAVEPNTEMDAVKYITMYAYLPKLCRILQEKQMEEDVIVHMRLHDTGYFSLYDELEDQWYRYGFSQNYIDITHGADLKMLDRNDAEAIWSTTEDAGLEKFKKAGLDSGRSPYSRVTLSLDWSGRNRKLTYRAMTDNQKDQFSLSFPGQPEQQWNQMMNVLKKQGWVSEKGIVLKPWSEMKEEADKTLLSYFDMEQICLIENIIFSQIGLLGEAVPEIEIEFIGCGIYVSKKFMREKKTELKHYSGFLM